VGAVVIKRGGSVDELAAAARVEAQQAQLLTDWVRREAKYVNADGSWVRKPGDAQDAAPQLAASLERAGQPRPPGSQPHHLVGFAELEDDTQRLLTRFGITPNEASNGIWLSPEAHRKTYGDDYKKWMNTQLGGATTADQARAILQDVRETLTKIQNELRLNNPTPVSLPWRPSGS
jgi:hypothetical protein